MNFSPRLSEAPSVVARRRSRWERLGFLARNRYQLAGATLLAVLGPTLIHREFDLAPPFQTSADNTAYAALAAVLLGALVLRHMTAYPGVQRFAFVLPTFVALYGMILLTLVYFRLDYSRLQLLASFIVTIAWFYLVVNVERYARRPNLLVVPAGDAPGLIELPEADWRLAASPGSTPTGVTGVVADLRAEHDDAWERFLARCALEGLPVYHCKEIKESLTGRVEIEHLSENNLGSLVPSFVYMRFKRLTDITIALAATPVAAPIAALAAIAIKLDDGGPVLFRQTRMGFRGRTFEMLKFRTMRVDAAETGRHYTEADDPRITRVGRLMRHYRIDELPQIVNILKGEMSWIGPRPESLPLSEWYESRIPFYSYRHIVRPGITGWAQVNQGNVAKVEAATAKLHYDFYYIRYFSPWLELLIAAKTVRTVLLGFGAR